MLDTIQMGLKNCQQHREDDLDSSKYIKSLVSFENKPKFSFVIHFNTIDRLFGILLIDIGFNVIEEKCIVFIQF